MTKVLLTHTPQARRQYYGERSLNGLQALAKVRLRLSCQVRVTEAARLASRARTGLAPK